MIEYYRIRPEGIIGQNYRLHVHNKLPVNRSSFVTSYFIEGPVKPVITKNESSFRLKKYSTTQNQFPSLNLYNFEVHNMNANETFSYPFLFTNKPSISQNKNYTFYHLGSKFWYFPLYYSFAFVIYVGYLLIKTAVVRAINFFPGLQQLLN